MRTDSETIRVLENRVSIREYADIEVDDTVLSAILRAGSRAPTASNLQAYSVVVVRDSSRKQQLAMLAGHQEHIARAPVFLAFCSDLSRVRCACDIHDRPAEALTNMDMALTGVIDAALAGMATMLAAESLGLGCVMIGGVRNSPIEIAQLLTLPKNAFVAFGMCIGWPRGKPAQKPRFPIEAIVHREQYDESTREQILLRYDGLLADHYDAQNRPADRSAWTRRVAEDFSLPRRIHLRESLRALGFEFS